MTPAPIPLTKELVLLGGGHTHALVLRMWGMDPLAGVSVTVINPAPSAPYTGMLPGYIAGHYNREELDIDLVPLAQFAGARFINDSAVAIDPVAKKVTLNSGRVVSYDTLSIDIGITAELSEIAGFSDFAVGVKPMDRFAAKWRAFCDSNSKGHVAIIGGGVGAAELALAIRHQLKDGPKITLIEQSKILSNMTIRAATKLRKTLGESSIDVIEGSKVALVEKTNITLTDGTPIPSDFTIGAAGARAYTWLQDTGLDLQDGYIRVNSDLSTLANSDVFAVGDCAHMDANPRPKAGVFAVRQAPVLLHNLRAQLSGQKPRDFKPQRDYLKLISLGQKSAMADKWGLVWSGVNAWRLKDRIDRKFMDQFRNLPTMAGVDLPQNRALGVDDILNGRPLCGGCGAKAGGKVLTDVLRQQGTPNRPDVITGIGDDAAVLSGPDGQRQVISTDHLRAFTNDPYLMAKIAATHALGDIWGMGAAPQTALASTILPRMSEPMQKAWLTEIMDAAGEVFASEGAQIVGGHTSVGSELTIGFTVTGLSQKPIGINGAKPGDVLVLTKPIGNGTILAGEMAGQAKGRWVVDTLAQMATPQGAQSRALAGANAMTDVTGFGLAGHAMAIAKASDVSITVNKGAVPLYAGAMELAERGVRSSLFEANIANVGICDETCDPLTALMFDPQTAGGVLATIPGAHIERLAGDFNALGQGFHVIGTVSRGPAALRFI